MFSQAFQTFDRSQLTSSSLTEAKAPQDNVRPFFDSAAQQLDNQLATNNTTAFWTTFPKRVEDSVLTHGLEHGAVQPGEATCYRGIGRLNINTSRQKLTANTPPETVLDVPKHLPRQAHAIRQQYRYNATAQQFAAYLKVGDQHDKKQRIMATINDIIPGLNQPTLGQHIATITHNSNPAAQQLAIAEHDDLTNILANQHDDYRPNHVLL